MLLTSIIQNLLFTTNLINNLQTAIDALFPQIDQLTRVALFYSCKTDCLFVLTLSQYTAKYDSTIVLINYEDFDTNHFEFAGDRYLNIFVFQNVSTMFNEVSKLKTKKIKNLTSYLMIIREPLNLTENWHDSNVSHTQIDSVIRHLWKFKILQMVLLCWNYNYDLFAYTLNPFMHQFEIKLFEIKSSDGNLIDHNANQYYWRKTRNLNHYNVSCFMYHTPPKVVWLPTAWRLPGLFYFGGRDGYLTSVVSKMFNTRFTYYTFQADQLMQFKMIYYGNASIMTKTPYGNLVPGDDVIPYNLKLLKGNITENITALTEKYTPEFIMMSRLRTYKDSPHYEQLYPHEFDHICVMVPNLSQHIPFSINQIFQPLPIKLVPVTLIIVVIVWKMLRDFIKFKRNNYSLVMMYTMGIYLATGADYRSKNNTERILMLSLFIFSQITIVAVAGMLYKSIVIPEKTSNIETLQELAKTSYTILINKEYSENIEEWSINLDPELNKKLQPTNENTMIEMILKGNLSNAYVLSQMKAKLIMQKKELWLNENNIFHLMDECLFPGLMSYQVLKGSPLKHQAERFIEYVIQYGLMEVYVTWISRFIFSQNDSNVYTPGYFEIHRKSTNPLTSADLNSLMILYAIGICISICVFVLEVLSRHLIFTKIRFGRKHKLVVRPKAVMSFDNKLQINNNR